MEIRSSFLQQFLVVILSVCINMSLANVAFGFSQTANSSAATPEQLDKLLAPVALYPDALLMQVLAASVNSQEVLDGGNWLLQNKRLQGDQLDSAAKAAGFGPAMQALFHFPQVVDMMCSEMDWTKQLGDAFNANQSAVLDSVQRLRMQAKQAGNLQTTPQQTVVTQQASGQQVIVIQPTNPQVVYVPQYNPVQVYVAPPPSQPATGVIVAFGVGMAVGSMFSSNNYYYPRWGYGGGVYYRGGPWVSIIISIVRFMVPTTIARRCTIGRQITLTLIIGPIPATPTTTRTVTTAITAAIRTIKTGAITRSIET